MKKISTSYNLEEKDIVNVRLETLSVFNVITGIKLNEQQFSCLFSVPVEFVSSEELQERSGLNKAIGATIYKNGDLRIFISNDENKSLQINTLSHEYIHAISYLVYGTFDKFHNNRDLWVSTHSVEHESANLLGVPWYVYTEQDVAACNKTCYGTTGNNEVKWDNNNVIIKHHNAIIFVLGIATFVGSIVWMIGQTG